MIQTKYSTRERQAGAASANVLHKKYVLVRIMTAVIMKSIAK